jgi:hypothetical protein
MTQHRKWIDLDTTELQRVQDRYRGEVVDSHWEPWAKARTHLAEALGFADKDNERATKHLRAALDDLETCSDALDAKCLNTLRLAHGALESGQHLSCFCLLNWRMSDMAAAITKHLMAL